MLDPGVGQALEKEVRDVAVKAAKAFESAGAVVTEVDGILTREMLDGLDNFWRARMWDDLSKLTPAGARQGAALYLQMGGSRRKAVRRRRRSGASTPPWRSAPRRQNCSAISTM